MIPAEVLASIKKNRSSDFGHESSDGRFWSNYTKREDALNITLNAIASSSLEHDYFFTQFKIPQQTAYDAISTLWGLCRPPPINERVA